MLTGSVSVVTFVVACLVGASRIDGANILLIPFSNTSHFLEMDGVGRPLVARGHNVYVLLDEDTTVPKGGAYKVVTYRNSYKKVVMFNADTKLQHKLVETSQAGMNMSQMFELIRDLCSNMLSDKELLPHLKSLKFDLAIVDNFFMPCYFIVPHMLGVPIVSVGSVLTSWRARVPILPSMVRPQLGLEAFGIPMCEETEGQWSIVRRMCRLIPLVMQEGMMLFIEEDYLREFVPDFPPTREIRENVAINLINSNFLLSSPLPKLPNVEYVGGLTTKQPKPLEPSLEKWMSESPNVVVVSFGSNLGSLPPAKAEKLFEGFGKLTKYRFIFRFNKEESLAHKVPSNVRVMDWLPQNDVLGHNSTLAFITHSGNNGQQEALFHGVPMLCFYVFADQKSNAKRVVRLGYGKMLDIHSFTVDELVGAVTDLVEDKKYSAKIKLASLVFHSEKHPSERAADAVEHVLKFGSDHLRSKDAYALSFWEFYMLDILAVLYLIALVALIATFKLLKCVLRCAFGGSKSSNKEKHD